MSKIFKLRSVKATFTRILQTGHLTSKKVTISELGISYQVSNTKSSWIKLRVKLKILSLISIYV